MPELDTLLERTSRTFALSIPRLPDPTRREVTVAYLLFRIADTFEDTTAWPRRERIEALDLFCDLIGEAPGEDVEAHARRWATEMPLEHDGYRELMEATPFVLDEFRDLRAGGREHIREHLTRTARGMARYVERTDDGRLELRGLRDLRDYCYIVAGIVGEMLTDLFLLGRPGLREVEDVLRERAADFGEGLQLVNVLKDSATDAREGRIYLPDGVDRQEVFRIARGDLDRAAEYVLALQRSGAEPGIVAFNALPVRLAWATLDAVEERGPGSKISRPELWTIVESLEDALSEDRPAVPRPA